MHSAIHVEGKRPPRPRKTPVGKKSSIKRSSVNGASLEATLLQLPSATSLEMGPVDDSELTSIEIDGQTLFWTRVDGQRESITVDAVVEGDLNDFFIIPAVTQASISEVSLEFGFSLCYPMRIIGSLSNSFALYFIEPIDRVKSNYLG